jgi:cytokinin dehydrogenase
MPDPRLSDDPDRLSAAARDFGDIVHDRPAHVAKPTSTDEVAELVRWARSRGLAIAARGVGHSAGGQAQVAGGLVIDMSGLDQIHDVDRTAGVFTAGAGVRWRQLLAELLPLGLTPAVVTDWLELTLGGTTSAGGVGSQSFRHGLQTDAIVAVTVVTGTGEIVECSAEHDPELFDAVRGGLGQYGIITRVRMRVGPAPRRAIVDHLVFDDVVGLVDAVDALRAEGVEGLLAHAVPNQRDAVARSLRCATEQVAETALPSGPRWLYDLEVLRHGELDDAPQLAPLARELGAIASLARRDGSTFAEFIHRVPPIVERDQRAGRAPHPELALFVGQARAREFFAEIMGGLDVEDLGGGPVLLIPLTRAVIRSPFVRLPDDEHAWLFGLLRAAPRPELVEAMTRDNVRIWRHGSQLGALRYPVDGLPEPSSRAAWAAHFGPVWARAEALKQRVDPDGLLAPRLGIFAR